MRAAGLIILIILNVAAVILETVEEYNLAYGHIVTSNIARGRIASLDTRAAERAPGVIKVVTHQNSIKPTPKDRVREPREQQRADDQKKPGDRPFRALVSEAQS